MQPTPDDAARALRLTDDALMGECDVSFFVGPGPGGQHRNKTSTAVRLVHRPTGLTIVATELRSQFRNRSVALERLRAKLTALAHVPTPRVATRTPRSVKRRRLEDKRRNSEKKHSRKVDW